MERPAALRGEERLRRAISAWVDGARRRASWIALGAALLTGACALYAARNLEVETNTEAVFDPDLRFRQLENALDAAFPMLEDAVIVVLDAPSARRAADAAEALAERLAASPELYADVFVPGAGPFFARHGLLYRDVDDLEDLVDRLAAAQPFLAELSRDPSLRGLFRMFERALGEAEAAAERGLDLEEALADVEAAVRESARRQVRPMDFDALLVGADAGDGARRYVLAQPRIDYGELVPALDAMRALRGHIDELGFGPGGDVRARFTGNLPLSTEELDIVQRQSVLAGAASFAIVTLILFLALRSVRLVLATAATLLAGLVWTAAFAVLAIGHLNMISVNFAVLFIGLGVDFGIHFGLRYRELRVQGEDHARALEETGSGVGTSLVLCALTTATSFLAFTPTAYVGIGELGLIAGAGMFVSLLASLTLLPALLSLGGVGTPTAFSPRESRSVLRFPGRHPGLVAAAAAVLAGISLLLAPGLSFDGNPLRVRDPGAESVRTFAELVEEGDLNPWTAEVLAPSLEEARRLAERLEALPGVDRSVTLASYLPEDQEEKRALLDDARFLLNLTPPAGRRPAPGPREQRQALAGFRAALARFVASAPPSVLSEGAARVEAALADLLSEMEPGAGDGRLDSLTASLVEPIAEGLAELEVALGPGEVGLDTLPPELRRRLLAPDGRARVQVFPAADLNDNQALEAFAAEVRRVAPDASGDSIYLLESGRTVTRSLRQAFAGAALIILAGLWLIWRRALDTALVLAPVLLAAVLVVGFCALAMPLNFANVIVLPLLLGIGVDSGIHMVHRHRSGGAELLATSTPRAVGWSALTTIASFGTLAFATHRGMASLGQLLALGVVLTVAANLVVLPALLALARRREG